MGDERVNQNLDLALMHTYWTRYHNKIASEMAGIYPEWDDEQLFQETRRILIAIYQKIMFYDVFPWILGCDNICEHGLVYSSLSQIDDYNNTCKPNILSEFVHAASKGLHAMVLRKLEYFNEKRNAFKDISMKDSFYRPYSIEEESNFDALSIGQTTQNPNHQGPNFENDMTNFTYTDVLKYVLDLPAQDIWRSRWAGTPSYNDIRSECGLIRATDFDEFRDAIDPQNIEKLKSVYRNVDDVDLYVGGLLERNYPGAKVGTTFFWIFIQQLLRFRQCDRFWYEHPEAGFTKIQLKIIKGVTLSSIMCETG
ncbi:peroxidase-like, partial [Diorhabda sublineata]|uniref:peroxidase-like n=1 Tax=Diorhabda sublineata TaxID=1163346 RepID=UPI0024E0DB98